MTDPEPNGRSGICHSHGCLPHWRERAQHRTCARCPGAPPPTALRARDRSNDRKDGKEEGTELKAALSSSVAGPGFAPRDPAALRPSGVLWEAWGRGKAGQLSTPGQPGGPWAGGGVACRQGRGVRDLHPHCPACARLRLSGGGEDVLGLVSPLWGTGISAFVPHRSQPCVLVL